MSTVAFKYFLIHEAHVLNFGLMNMYYTLWTDMKGVAR